MNVSFAITLAKHVENEIEFVFDRSVPELVFDYVTSQIYQISSNGGHSVYEYNGTILPEPVDIYALDQSNLNVSDAYLRWYPANLLLKSPFGLVTVK